MKSLILSFSVVSFLVMAGCVSQTTNVSDMPQFETIDEYMMLVANDENDTYVVEKPEGYESILFGNEPMKYNLDGVPGEYVILVDENRETSTGLHDDHIFYLEGNVIDEDCYGDMLQGDIETSECPNLTMWFGPFYGKALDFMQ